MISTELPMLGPAFAPLVIRVAPGTPRLVLKYEAPAAETPAVTYHPIHSPPVTRTMTTRVLSLPRRTHTEERSR